MCKTAGQSKNTCHVGPISILSSEVLFHKSLSTHFKRTFLNASISQLIKSVECSSSCSPKDLLLVHKLFYAVGECRQQHGRTQWTATQCATPIQNDMMDWDTGYNITLMPKCFSQIKYVLFFCVLNILNGELVSSCSIITTIWINLYLSHRLDKWILTQ